MNWLAFHFDPSLMQQLDQGHEVESKVAALISAGPQPSSRPKLHTMTLENLGKHLQVRAGTATRCADRYP